MRPQIKIQKSVLASIRYNENKITEGKAKRIGAENFLKDHDQLIKKDIIERFRQRYSLNERLHEHGVHISVNFGKLEKIDDQKMAQIAIRFMTGIGFEDQPYVVYRHSDAGHTHLHIVATNVQADGTNLHLERKDFLGAHALSKKLEKEFNLEQEIRARPEAQRQFDVDRAQRVLYGETSLKHAISDVLNTVVNHYSYTSLEEFNAILRQYNVVANAGAKNSYLHQKGGLLYHALDANGKRVGVPIQASSFLLKPTLKNLEKKFLQNQSLREIQRERLHTAIEWALAGRAPDWKQFTENLEKEGVAVVTDSKDDKERVFFVDHANKCAFADAGLRKGYDLQCLRDRCAPEQQLSEEHIQKHDLNLHI